jgi:hypothetical protein
MTAWKFVWPRPRTVALGVLLLCATSACGNAKSNAGRGSGSGSNTGGSAMNTPGGSATETNVAGIHCFTDTDCGAGRACMHFPGQNDGACSSDDEDGGAVHGPNTRGAIADAGASTMPGPHIGGLAAKCDVDADCGSVKCLHPNGNDQPGVCDVAQMGAR